MTDLMKVENGLTILSKEEMYDLMAANTNGQASEFDLPHVTVPAGGGIAWEVTDENGNADTAKAIDGVIVHFYEPKRRYENPYTPGSSAPPDCFSKDGVHGVGDPGVLCADCPHNQWGTGKDSQGNPTAGKACREYRDFFILRQGEVLPTIVSAPPTSLRGAGQYLLQLASKSKKKSAVITRFALEKGPKGSIIKMTRVGDLSPEDARKAEEYGKIVAAFFCKNPVVDPEPSV